MRFVCDHPAKVVIAHAAAGFLSDGSDYGLHFYNKPSII